MPLTKTRLLEWSAQKLYFDGENDYVKISANSLLDVTNTSARTIEIFFLVSSIPLDTGADDYWLLFSDQYGGIDIRIYDFDKFVVKNHGIWQIHGSTTKVSNYFNTFVHLVHILDGVISKLYINAELDSTFTFSDINSSSGYKTIGIGSTSYFKGYIAFVRIYNRALSEGEILHNYYYPDNPVRTGLVLWLHYDSISGSTWSDKSGLGNDGTIYGATPMPFNRPILRTQNASRTLTPLR